MQPPAAEARRFSGGRSCGVAVACKENADSQARLAFSSMRLCGACSICSKMLRIFGTPKTKGF